MKFVLLEVKILCCYRFFEVLLFFLFLRGCFIQVTLMDGPLHSPQQGICSQGRMSVGGRCL